VGEGLCRWNAKDVYILQIWHCRFLAVELDVQPRSDLPNFGLAPASPCRCIRPKMTRRLDLSAEGMRHRVRLMFKGKATTLGAATDLIAYRHLANPLI
jgi:hypothetical protein